MALKSASSNNSSSNTPAPSPLPSPGTVPSGFNPGIGGNNAALGMKTPMPLYPTNYIPTGGATMPTQQSYNNYASNFNPASNSVVNNAPLSSSQHRKPPPPPQHTATIGTVNASGLTAYTNNSFLSTTNNSSNPLKTGFNSSTVSGNNSRQ